MATTLTFTDLEKVYDLVANAIDAAGPENETLFLSKLCITLAHNIPDITVIESAIETAGKDLQN